MTITVPSKDEILQYFWIGREEGFTALEHEIIFRDLCTGCGACGAICPEDVVEIAEYPRLKKPCSNCGYCLIQCQRSFFPRQEIEEKLFGRIGGLLGNCELMTAAKAKGAKGQDGGVVTAILGYMLENKIIDGAIVSGVSKDTLWRPEPKLATTVKEVVSAAGSRYSTSPNLTALKEAKGLKKIAVVGTPCQIQAIRKLQLFPIEGAEIAKNVKFTIALFCKGNFLYQMLEDVIAGRYKIKLKDVKKFDIKGKNLHVYVGKKIKEIPLTELREYEREGCGICTDFTGKFSDISVGSVGSPKGFSTVFARTKEALQVLKKMINSGVIETEEIDLPAIEQLAMKKEKDGKKNIRKRLIAELPLPFKFLEF